ncbi:putative outer membrane protein [Pedobacter sp. BAL39]|uniref:SusC/RagA family TonB-linked outer membrane protein n=1 Tax=Pedobacter sp. BAL39 TaxID=391596 RepID=UPI000155A5B8|nr:SusC/RagA family TonB-linked outer membrane protein [Pedobacter sp. BAL39]EDM33978.1 putative outer membrane protein [Pedobacter sp. BAL39]
MILLCCFSASQVNAQTKIRLTGIVTDNTNLGIPGATIFSGTPLKSLTATNNKGEYSVSVDDGAEIVIRSIGYTEQRIKLKAGQTVLNVVLKDNAKEMDEVVVRGYVARSKKLTTGSSNKVDGSVLQGSPSSNVESLLQGKVPGLNIQVNTGAPGFRGSTSIRGLSSLSVTGSGSEAFLQPTSPLYVIDGIPLDADQASQFGFQQQGPGVSPLSMIPQEDIESIEILKDAQATSLYGSRAAYGVIIITTKRGNSPIPRIRYTLNSFMQKPPKLRETLGGNLERQLKLRRIIENAITQGDIDRISGTAFLSDSLNAYYNNSTNWQGVFYRTTFNQQHNLAIDGGDSKFNYKTNLNYYSENGIIQNTGFDRYNLTMRMEYQPSPKFQFVGSVFGGVGKTNKGDGLGLFQTGVANNGQASSLLPGPSFFQSSGGVVSALDTKNDNNARNLRTNVEVAYSAFEGFRASTNVSYNFNSNTEDTFTPAAANGQFAKVYAFTGRDDRLYNRSALTYSKRFWGDKHGIFVNAFSEVYVEGRQSSISRQERTPNDQFQGPLGYDAYNSRGGGVLTDYRNFRSAAFAGAITYDFSSKYVMDLTYRFDGNSGNGIDNPYSKNPSIGLRWNFKDENWFKDAKWLGSGALRMTWGKVISPNSSLVDIYGRYNISGNYNGNQGIGIDFGLIPNPTLKPTTSTTYNVAFEASMFDNFVDFVYETYYKSVDNMVLARGLSNITGFGVLKSNDAGIVNYGHELSVNFRPLRKGKWTLAINVNGAYNNDVLTKLPADYNGQMIQFDGSKYLQHTVFRVGANTLSNYLRVNQGVYSRDTDVPVDPMTGLLYRTNGTFFEGGDPIWRDMNGDYILDGRDYMIAGNSQPLLVGGLGFNLTYNDFRLDVYGSFTSNRTILNNALADRLGLMRDPFGDRSVVPLSDLDMWLRPGDVAKYPYAYSYARINSIDPFRADQTLWEENGTYLKINTITFSYTFKKQFVRRIGLNNLRVYVSGENLKTFTNYTGPNPENVTNMGRDASEGYPVPRKYNLGLNVEF